jgi:hypothetical protein
MTHPVHPGAFEQARWSDTKGPAVLTATGQEPMVR